jgi:hypothetical protein
LFKTLEKSTTQRLQHTPTKPPRTQSEYMVFTALAQLNFESWCVSWGWCKPPMASAPHPSDGKKGVPVPSEVGVVVM